MSGDLSSLDLRRAIRAKFAWPGGYCLLFVTDDGATLCADCARKEYRQVAHARRHGLSSGWRIVAVSNGSECDGSAPCDHCGAELGAYLPEPEDTARPFVVPVAGGFFAGRDFHADPPEDSEPCECGASEAEQRPCICASLRDGSLIGLTAPGAWASYLINGDASGLEDSEERDADRWLDSLADTVEPGGPVDCRPYGFTRRPDSGGLACDAETFYFFAKRDTVHSPATAPAA
jgi:hypothetical protein